MSRDRAPVVDLCCSPSPGPAAKRPRTERKAGVPRVRDMHDEIVDLSLMDSPDPGPEQRGRSQLAEGQVERNHRLWGELPAAEAGCEAGQADGGGQQVSQARARRSRRPYMLPPMAAPAPPAQQPQRAAQRQWHLQRPGKLEDEEDGLSEDELILLGSRDAGDTEAAAPQRAAPNSRRRQFMPPQQLLAGAAPPPPGSPPRASYAAEHLGRRFSSLHAHKAQQDADLARRLQAQEQIALARERQRARFQAQQQQVQQAYMQRHMEQLASLEVAAAEAAAAAGGGSHQHGGRGGLGNWSDGGSNDEEDDPWSNAADDAMFGTHPPWAVFGSEDASPPRRGGRAARRSYTHQRSGPRGSRQRQDWGGGGGSASSLADAMLGMLSETGSWGGVHVGGGPGVGHLHMQPQTGLGGRDYTSMGGALAAMRAAMSGLTAQSRLPPSMLFSDRDFTADDYEALLALDEGIDNRKGASKEVIEAIPTLTVGGKGGGLAPDDDPRCCICLADYAPGATLRKLPCSHQFHKACLDTWLAQKATCPICQAAAAAGGSS